MPKPIHIRPADLRGLVRMTAHGVVEVTDVVEAMHVAIARPLTMRRAGLPGRAFGIAGLVYRSIRGIARLAGGGIDAALAPATPLLEDAESSRIREGLLAALNGVVGDYLAASDNPLAIPMRLRRDGRPLDPAALDRPGGKILVLVHGLCMNDLQWRWNGHDHGAALAADLGYFPVYLSYNSGRHISLNGREFADRLEDLLRAWPEPVEELAIVAHSMGGLVSRSACHYGAAAGHAWPGRLRHLVFLGTPHQGAALERGGNWVHGALGATPYTAALARVPRLRSAGITDLRHAALLDEDWHGRDRFARSAAPVQVPLPAGVACYAVGTTTIGSRAGGPGSQRQTDDLRASAPRRRRRIPGGALIGDGLVPLSSALGQHADSARALEFPPERQWVGAGIHHFDMLGRPEIYRRIKDWLGGDLTEA